MAYYKLSPAASTAVRLVFGKDPITGQRMTLSDEVMRNFEPMFIQDTIELLQDNPKNFPLIPLGFYGAGLQTYQPKQGGNLRLMMPR